MLGELLSHVEKRIVPPPSEEFLGFIQQVQHGENPQIPSFGQPALFDFYGRNKKGVEVGRYRVILGQTERSFHIAHLPGGIFQVTDEGLFPFTDK